MRTFKEYLREDIPGITMRIIMLGGPGSGKSTYSEYLVKHFRIPHVYTGDMMRDLAKQDTPIGRKVRSALDKGNYVDTKIVLDTLETRLKNKDTETGCTIHFVNEVVDAGPILIQKKCNVDPDDTVDSLKTKVQTLEGETFIEAIKLTQLKDT